MELIQDLLGGLLWILMFFAPLISVLIFWRYKTIKWYLRIIFGLFLGLVASAFFYIVALEIIFRHGMGP
jgi:hypothetical protein